MKDRKMSFYNRIVKRMLDIICSLAAIVCLSVLYLPICAIIKCTSEGPVFFRQKRIGDEYGINDLKPGLTGWAQINGRDELPIPEKVQMDKIYRDNVSFVFDVKCLFMTVVSVFKHDGVVEGGTGNMNNNCD